MIYNRRLISDAAMPKSHDALRLWLESHAGRREARIATYDPALSATGYLYLAQDKQAFRGFWQLAAAMGRNSPRLFGTANGVLEDVAAGRSAIGYNVVGAYALDAASRNPDLGVVLPYDYTLIMSRIAMIPTRAPHPNAARLFLDFLLSRRGQAALAAHRMTSVRTDTPRPPMMTQRPGAMRAIRVGPTLLVTQDRLTRESFMRKWRQALAKR
jgi:iron(III) transport system substrate-binding protein